MQQGTTTRPPAAQKGSPQNPPAQRNAQAPAAPAEEQVALALPAGFDFTPDEVKGGIDESGGGYLAQYPLLVKQTLNMFEMLDSKTGEVVWQGDKLPCVIYYGHSVYRLHRGTVEGATGDFKHWTDDQKELVAQSLGSPFGDVQKSRGDFDVNGYKDYLDNKELRKEVSKRLYLFVRPPRTITGGVDMLAAVTFAGSALKPFQTFVQQLKGINAPLPLVKSVIGTKPAVSEAGDPYNQVTFDVLKKDGKVATTVADSNEYREKIKPVLDKIIETHVYAMRRIEQSTGTEREVSSAPASRQLPPANKAAVYEPSPGESDTIPGAFSDDDLGL